MSKREKQRKHARRRYYERLGVRLTQEHHDALVRTIQTGAARLVEKQSLRVKVYEMSVEDRLCKVIYDRLRKQIVTLWPVDDEYSQLMEALH